MIKSSIQTESENQRLYYIFYIALPWSINLRAGIIKIFKIPLFPIIFVCFNQNNYAQTVNTITANVTKISLNQSGLSTAIPTSNKKPILYYFSSPGCPACYAMDPVVKQAKSHYKKKIDTKIFVGNSKERLKLLRRYTRNVDVRYVPFTILADVDGRLLSYSKGYTPREILFKQIDEGLEKQSRLPNFEISEMMFVCHYDYDICPKLEKELKSWITSKKTSKIKLNKVDIRSIQKPEDMKKFNSYLEKMKYLYGLDHIPAVIGLTKDSEVIGILQTVFSQNSLEAEFKGQY